MCLAAALAAALFLYGLTVQSYWALALPVAAVLLFILGLAFWIGWTIATIQVEGRGDPLVSAGGPGSATTSDPEEPTPTTEAAQDEG